MVVNVHERTFQVGSAELAALVGTLSSSTDRLWPGESWPRMRLDPGLTVGANGGHGPIRYRVERVDPGEAEFRFTSPAGFHGSHMFSVVAVTSMTSVLRHELRMRVDGGALLSWPLLYRPLHDALIEEAFDKAARELGMPSTAPHRRSWRVRILRAIAATSGRAR